MSSIYKKGRDGFYYYQTYIYNPQNGKKDKRIFHALGTKDRIEAKKKQEAYDLKYEEKTQKYSKQEISKFNFRKKPVLLTLALSACILSYLISFKISHQIQIKPTIYTETENITMLEDLSHSLPNSSSKEMNDDNNLATEAQSRPDAALIKNEPIVEIPKYTIERIKRLPSAFNQGKVFVTIDKNTSYESKRLLCKDLVKRYKEFSNIVICLYADNTSGVDLARGLNELVSIEEQKKIWLAMYSYNPVEGEYFDDNPSRYLGIY